MPPSYNMTARLTMEPACSSQDRFPMRNEAAGPGRRAAGAAPGTPCNRLWTPNTHICCSSPILEFWNWQCRFCEYQIHQTPFCLFVLAAASPPPQRCRFQLCEVLRNTLDLQGIKLPSSQVWILFCICLKHPGSVTRANMMCPAQRNSHLAGFFLADGSLPCPTQ